MGIRNHQVFDVILILNSAGCFAPPTTPLCAICIQWLGFRVATMRQRDHHILLRNHVFHGEVFHGLDNFCLALVAVLVAYFDQFLANNFHQSAPACQNFQELGYIVDNLSVFV